jgi:trehalose-6-phosphatase
MCGAELPSIGLAAEHGFYYRWGQSPSSSRVTSAIGTPLMRGGQMTDVAPALISDDGGDWHVISEHVDMSWKTISAALMEQYSERTSGSFVLRKGSCVLWHHGEADRDFGELQVRRAVSSPLPSLSCTSVDGACPLPCCLTQAKELQDHLTLVLRNFPVSVLIGKDYVEVRPRVSRRVAAVALA